jgi:DNA-binding NarL/FixJ family response regulator
VKALGETEAARLLVVDDHALVRRGIIATVSTCPALTVVGEAKDGHEAVALCRVLRPDLVLMDLSMPGMGGIEATRMIKAHLPKTSVLILTGYAEEDLLMEAVRAGAAGYVLKGGEPTELVDAVCAVLSGETPLDQGLAMRLLRRIGEQSAAPPADSRHTPPGVFAEAGPRGTPPKPLTPRETEVLGHLARGEPNRQIAQELHVSLSTVKRHVERIIFKLEVSDRTQAAVKALELGLLPRDPSG